MTKPFAALNWQAMPGLPVRSPQAHKGSFGHVFAVGGGPGMGGALALASAAAYRVGTGLVTAVGASLRDPLLGGTPARSDLARRMAGALPAPSAVLCATLPNCPIRAASSRG